MILTLISNLLVFVAIVALYIFIRLELRKHDARHTRLAQYRVGALEALEKLARGEFKRLDGRLTQVQVKTKMAEKVADRANTLASSANIGVAILQRGFQIKKLPNTPLQDEKNRRVLSQLTKDNADIVDWLEPSLTEEERKIVEFARENNGAA